MNPIFQRLRILTGDQTFHRLQASRVIIFGVGGVGSWCAESLIRSGIGHLTIVDSDTICVTNINRQLQATTNNVGKSKVDELKLRLLEINPEADVHAITRIYDRDTSGEFTLDDYNFVIDSIDSLRCKIELIFRATASKATLFSSMGASLKMDPTRIKISSIWNTDKCRLAAIVRKRLRQNKYAGDFQCVFSDELLPLYPIPIGCQTSDCLCPKSVKNNSLEHSHEWCSSKKQINGTIMHITATFGLFLSHLVIQKIHSLSNNTDAL